MPEGWELQSTAEAPAVFSPNGKDTRAFMYARSADKKTLKISTVEELNALDLKGMKEHSPEAKSEKTGTLKIASGKEIPVHTFSFKDGSELVAYAEEKETITVLVLSTESLKQMEGYRKVFEKLVASYAFIEGLVEEQKEPAKPEEKAKDAASGKK